MGRVVTGPGNGRPPTRRGTVTSEYRNPFRSAAVSPERIDQGVDYAGRSGDPIYAIGPAKVIEVINYGGNSGWPDGSGAGTSGGWVSYQLSSGPLMGNIVYVAEGVQPAVKVGDRIDSSTVVGHFAGAGGIETGWAGPPSQGDQTLAYDQGQSDFSGGDIGGWNTAAGVEFSNLMASLGAPAGIAQAGGVHGSGGQLVSLTATQTSPGGGGGFLSSGAGPDCLIGFSLGGGGISSFIGGIVAPGSGSVSTSGGGVCLLSKSQARAIQGGAFMLLGGSVFLVASLILAAYGLKASGASEKARKAAGSVTEAAGAVTGQPEVIAVGKQVKSQGGRQAAVGAASRQASRRRAAENRAAAQGARARQAAQRQAAKPPPQKKGQAAKPPPQKKGQAAKPPPQKKGP